MKTTFSTNFNCFPTVNKLLVQHFLDLIRNSGSIYVIDIYSREIYLGQHIKKISAEWELLGFCHVDKVQEKNKTSFKLWTPSTPEVFKVA